MGYERIEVRDAAIIYLNVLYDRKSWQLRGAFKPKISTIGSRFKVEYLMEYDTADENYVFMLSSTGLCHKSSNIQVSWHKPKLTEYKSSSLTDQSIKYVVASMDLGEFSRCGIYDWKFMKL